MSTPTKPNEVYEPVRRSSSHNNMSSISNKKKSFKIKLPTFRVETEQSPENNEDNVLQTPLFQHSKGLNKDSKHMS